MIPGFENKLDNPNAYTFTPTGDQVADKAYSYKLVKKHNANKPESIDKPDTVYVEITVPDDLSEDDVPDDFFLSAAMAEFYRDLGPSNGAPKTRVKVDANGKQLTLLSKLIPDYNPRLKINPKEDFLNTCFIPAAAHLALMPLIEEFDLTPRNIDSQKNVKIDFGQSAFDFMKRTPNSDISDSFSGIWPSTASFPLDPVDIEIFPNLIFMKPWNVLFFKKKYTDHITLLNQASVSPEFNKIVHQYFFKALLFDKSIMKASFSAHIRDEDQLEKLSDHFDRRFKALKLVLAQSPKFRESIKNNFLEYKENILKEINIRNEEFIKKQKKHQGAPDGDKYKYYTSRIIDINSITEALDKLRAVFCDFNPELFQTSFGISFDAKNKFHHYAMQMCQACDDKSFGEQKLLNLITAQVDVKLAHFNDRRRFLFDRILEGFLLNIKSNVNNLSPLEQAEILFYADKIVSDILIEKERNQRCFNYYFDIKDYALEMLDCNARKEEILDKLSAAFVAPNHELFNNTFGVTFQAKNKFHQHAMQICHACNETSFDEKKLLNLIAARVEVKLAHFSDNRRFLFERTLGRFLLNIKSNVNDLPPLEQAEILFYADKIVSDILIEKERKEVSFYRDFDIEDSLFCHFKGYALEMLASNVSKEVVLDKFEKLFSEEQVECYKDDFEHEIDLFIFEEFKQEIAVNKTNISNQIRYFQILKGLLHPQKSDSTSKIDFFTNIDRALQTCIDYADHMKDKKIALAYLNKVNNLCLILQEGLSKKETNLEDMAVDLQAEIDIPDPLLHEHHGIKAIFLWFVNLFRSAESITASAKPIFSWLNTQRANLLNNITEVFVEEGVGPRLDR